MVHHKEQLRGLDPEFFVTVDDVYVYVADSLGFLLAKGRNYKEAIFRAIINRKRLKERLRKNIFK